MEGVLAASIALKTIGVLHLWSRNCVEVGNIALLVFLSACRVVQDLSVILVRLAALPVRLGITH